MPKRDYDQLPIIPALIAEDVVQAPYTGCEWSDRTRSKVEQVEAARQALTEEQRREFVDVCEQRCRHAYDADAKWMLDIANKEDGRGDLWVLFSHWLAAYVYNRELFIRKSYRALI